MSLIFQSIRLRQPRSSANRATYVLKSGGLSYSQPSVRFNATSDCGFEEVEFTPRNQSEAIGIAAKMADLAYAKNKEQRGDLEAMGYKVFTFNADIKKNPYLGSFMSHGSSEAGIVAFNEKTGETYISFHGTECVRDALTDGNAIKTPNPFGEGYLHGGFLNRYEECKDSLIATLKGLKKYGIDYEKVQLTITGHSMGGALATIAAADLQREHKVRLITFHSPRVFDREAAMEIMRVAETKRNPAPIRVWRKLDIVSAVSMSTTLLFGWMTGFTHVGESVALEAKGSWFEFLTNHAMKHTLAACLSPEKVSCDTNYFGVKDRAILATKRAFSWLTPSFLRA